VPTIQYFLDFTIQYFLDLTTACLMCQPPGQTYERFLKDNVMQVCPQSTLHPENAGQISKIKIRCLPLKLAILFINAVRYI
jgi:hypothetical protein